jgi:lysozyme
MGGGDGRTLDGDLALVCPMRSDQRDAVRQQLILHEGERLHPYVDTVSKITIGCGRNLTDNGITHAESRLLLDNDINTTISDLNSFPWFPDLDPIRQRALIDMCFNLGLIKFCTFRNMLNAIGQERWDRAGAEVLASRYAEQVGQRALTIAAMITTGRA